MPSNPRTASLIVCEQAIPVVILLKHRAAAIGAVRIIDALWTSMLVAEAAPCGLMMPAELVGGLVRLEFLAPRLVIVVVVTVARVEVFVAHSVIAFSRLQRAQSD